MNTESHRLQVERDESAEDALVYRLHGVLGETEGCYEFLDQIREEAKEAHFAGRSIVLFNMADVDFITSAGVGIIAACYTSTKNAGKQFLLSGVQKQPMKVLDITGVGRLVPHYDDEEAALNAARN